jgi:hypothetical protein
MNAVLDGAQSCLAPKADRCQAALALSLFLLG